jgi:hypothetical protein
MQIPKITLLPRRKFEKRCLEPGCGKPFIGIAVAKYCKKHQNPKNRKKKRRKDSDHSYNYFIKHDYIEPTRIVLRCKVPGCGKEFKILTEPKVYIYPGCCPEHRKCRPPELEHFTL